MSFPIEAPPDRPGHVGHTPQPQAQLGLRLGRYYDLAGGLFGSGVVRALLGQRVPGDRERREDAAGASAGILPDTDERVEYAMQPFGIPGGAGAFNSQAQQRKPRTAKEQTLAHMHTVLALEESAYKFRKKGVQPSIPESLAVALENERTWRSPR